MKPIASVLKKRPNWRFKFNHAERNLGTYTDAFMNSSSKSRAQTMRLALVSMALRRERRPNSGLGSETPVPNSGYFGLKMHRRIGNPIKARLMKWRVQGWAFFLIAITVLGLNESLSRGAEISTQSSLNDGYSQFYDFCNEESQLSLLLWFKTATPAISDYAKRISSTAKNDMALMKKLATSDGALKLDKVSLSGFEIEVRKSMADDRKQQLIWGSSGKSFSHAVEMTQSEATNYGMHVAKVLAESEPNAERARTMHHIYEEWVALHAEAYELSR